MTTKAPAVLERMAELTRAVNAADEQVTAAEALRSQSARWLPKAKAELASYLAGVDNGEKPDTKRHTELRNEVTDLEATVTHVTNRGQVTIHADSRAMAKLNAAVDAQQDALNELARFQVEHRAAIQAEMVQRAHAAHERLQEAIDVAAAGWSEWQNVRASWLPLLERWGMSRRDLPVLALSSPGAALQEERMRLHRDRGVPVLDSDLIPAPRHLIDDTPPPLS